MRKADRSACLRILMPTLWLLLGLYWHRTSGISRLKLFSAGSLEMSSVYLFFFGIYDAGSQLFSAGSPDIKHHFYYFIHFLVMAMREADRSACLRILMHPLAFIGSLLAQNLCYLSVEAFFCRLLRDVFLLFCLRNL